MPQSDSVWGIDIGQCALKAVKLRNIEGSLRVEAFDVIEHPKILSQPDADRELLVRNALEQFLARNNVAGSTVVVSAPGQSGFTRFVKLPPVEAKQVPEIVRFEAEQQIPFDINEVIWRWQTFLDPDSPDVEVGIFAMKRPDVMDVLDSFADVEISVDIVQMAPLALYNFMEFDGQTAEDGATLLVDVGADKTELVISDGPRIWARTLQLGGNNFTEALVKVFKLSFSKAEKLKRTAATSKYARQIFQAMRPVFAELVQEIQRSIGYYTSLHRESRFKRVIGLGNGSRLPGLQKFIEQNLGISVVRIDSYNRISPSATVNAPAFTENVLSFAVAYGLALQGLGLTKIQSNLLPQEIARQRLWRGKRWWFAGAAAALVVGFAIWTAGSARASGVLKDSGAQYLPNVQKILGDYKRLQSKYRKVEGLAHAEVKRIDEYRALHSYRDFFPALQQMVNDAIMKVAADQESLTEQDFEKNLKTKIRSQRQVVDVVEITAKYMPDLAEEPEKVRAGTGAGYTRNPRYNADSGRATPSGEPAAPRKVQRGFLLVLRATTPLGKGDANLLFNGIKDELVSLAGDYPQLEITWADATWEQVERGLGSGRSSGRLDEGMPYAVAGPDTPAILDPYTGEDAGNDTKFLVQWKIAIKDDFYKQAGKAVTGGAR